MLFKPADNELCTPTIIQMNGRIAPLLVPGLGVAQKILHGFFTGG